MTWGKRTSLPSYSASLPNRELSSFSRLKRPPCHAFKLRNGTAYILCFGAPLGLAIGASSTLHPRLRAQKQLAAFSFPRAIVVDSIAGIIGGWAFGKWMPQ